LALLLGAYHSEAGFEEPLAV